MVQHNRADLVEFNTCICYRTCIPRYYTCSSVHPLIFMAALFDMLRSWGLLGRPSSGEKVNKVWQSQTTESRAALGGSGLNVHVSTRTGLKKIVLIERNSEKTDVSINIIYIKLTCMHTNQKYIFCKNTYEWKKQVNRNSCLWGKEMQRKWMNK